MKDLIIGAGVLSFLAVPIYGAFSLIHWLRYGYWADWSLVNLGALPPQTSWRGVDSLLLDLYQSGMWVPLSLLGGALMLTAWLIPDPPKPAKKPIQSAPPTPAAPTRTYSLAELEVLDQRWREERDAKEAAKRNSAGESDVCAKPPTNK
jgi:hypothetical protein